MTFSIGLITLVLEFSKVIITGCFIIRVLKYNVSEKFMKKYRIEFYASRSEYNEIRSYFEEIPLRVIISGLRFSNNRYRANAGGYLNPGRKSLVKKETSLLTKKQAKVRLKNWKIMIKKYRESGYSYPTIYRIKMRLNAIVNDINP
ncbi:MAG TPA: hypothetical protein VJL78_08770 [Candidatus Nitrosocosmicus sp.]|jgi:hypothetical protein|nr:hypothetical protein [Candidatus Nitrosocosmicus sp.]